MTNSNPTTTTPPTPNTSSTSISTAYDYIIVGGGTAGCVLASRLSHAGHSVLVIEAGPEAYPDSVMSPVGASMLHGSEYEYNYMSEPQQHMGGRRLRNFGGRLLSGSSGINYGLFTRGHSLDYDAWSTHVSAPPITTSTSNPPFPSPLPPLWSYAHLHPYFLRTQTHHDPSDPPSLYGFTGPITTTSAATRAYPLAARVLAAYEECGVPFNAHANGGNPLGVGAYTEAWRDGRRQPAGMAYDLSRATVLTGEVVARVDLARTPTATGEGGKIKATGVTLHSGRSYTSTIETILCAGALRTPQVLLLSGIGAKEHLSSLGIPCAVDLPGVGANLHDHASTALFWQLTDEAAGKGFAMGDAAFDGREEFAGGTPASWLATVSVEEEEKEEGKCTSAEEQQPRGDIELLLFYGPATSPDTLLTSGMLPVPPHHLGRVLTTSIISLLPTSRGNVTLSDNSPLSPPLINPNYLSTARDRASLRAGLRLAIRLMTRTRALADIVVPEEIGAPEGTRPLSGGSTDEELDARVRATGASFFQNAGTCAMGEVVDVVGRVKGVRGLRVVDASVFPLPVAGHYMAPVYAFAEAMADVLLGRIGGEGVVQG